MQIRSRCFRSNHRGMRNGQFKSISRLSRHLPTRRENLSIDRAPQIFGVIIVVGDNGHLSLQCPGIFDHLAKCQISGVIQHLGHPSFTDTQSLRQPGLVCLLGSHRLLHLAHKVRAEPVKKIINAGFGPILHPPVSGNTAAIAMRTSGFALSATKRASIHPSVARSFFGA